MPRERRLTSPAPVVMDVRPSPSGTGSHAAGGPPLPDRPAHSSVLPPVSEVPSTSGPEMLSTGNLRNAFRHGVPVQSTVRAVTPEPGDVTLNGPDGIGGSVSQMPRGYGSASPPTSPRSIPAAPAALPARRQGVVFNDAFPSSLDGSSSPPPRPPSFRPRTHTMDGAFRQQLTPAAEARHRVGSFSAASISFADDHHRIANLQPPFESYRSTDLQPPTTFPIPKDRRSSNARSRLTKRPSSRPSSPLSSLPPTVDSLPLPVPTADANKVLLLMKKLCGRMRGEIEYQRDSGPWFGGVCYIEEEKGCLMFDSGDGGPFHIILVPDLRGCRVLPVERSDRDFQCLEIVSPSLGTALFLQPLVAEELDLWLAALLCWQQLRPAAAKLSIARPANAIAASGRAAEMRRRASSPGLREHATIIKVGKIMLWDKGVAASPRAIVKRPSTRDLRSSQTCWRRVSCILHDNGEFKIMTENDVTVLSVIELSQLARSAIQQLDKSVLDEDYCLAIFPIYSSTSTQLSIFRPVYIALESRVLLEVWFVLLRAFTVPDVYTLDPANGGRVYEVTDLHREPPGETFRVEKTIFLRVIEARIRRCTSNGDGDLLSERQGKASDSDPAVGNYLAEVILDGEVRARTATKTDTKNPFWREDCRFSDLPASLPYLSVLVKRVDVNTESFSHQLQTTLGLAKPGSLAEVLCGSVDIPLDILECGKDHEQWLQIYDDRQQSIGSMLIKVHHEELVVLLQQNYQPLSELLHRFSSGLTALITDALPGGNLRRVAEIFVNIFQVSGSANEWIMNMVEEEIDGIGNQTTLKKPRFSARLTSNDSIESTSDREQIVRDLGRSLQGEANLLFRGNSLLTQALEFHMRRLGKEYLRETLAEKINEINELDSSCEVDPSKVHDGEDIQQHWNLLIQQTSEIWDCITSSVTRLPAELRHILKYIRAVAEDRYGDFLRSVTYTSVSGFLFLRFLCPAILNPKLFGLLSDHPRPRAQRTLTLIAKSLQALANLSTIGKKETWMEPMNRFLSTQRQPFKDFLDAVCAIPVERTKVALPASYSTPITILGRLSPLAREGFPSLPYLVDHARNFAALVKLWADAHPASAGTSQVYEGDLLKFHNLCVALHRRTTECFARIEGLRAAAAAAAAAADRASQLGGGNGGGATTVDEHLADVIDRMSLGVKERDRERERDREGGERELERERDRDVVDLEG
ncbi:Inhibitory regulator protein BUD2/CLA2 [Madurella mycetomatis]|uniref:Inhibitory regulator protein BUD2/CLA2 n=1 Tax=Madurella mycetomatis TaxID=100816 RepID=A0A175WB59_9PEZI|nr:Inhibitory regulator protein BUD2/CLA2 [Madurella mycetomatis]KXX80853.1 Inhibitory regulator protein BUD2/CLA2 [Madurella mycetomatis]